MITVDLSLVFFDRISTYKVSRQSEGIEVMTDKKIQKPRIKIRKYNICDTSFKIESFCDSWQKSIKT